MRAHRLAHVHGGRVTTPGGFVTRPPRRYHIARGTGANDGTAAGACKGASGGGTLDIHPFGRVRDWCSTRPCTPSARPSGCSPFVAGALLSGRHGNRCRYHVPPTTLTGSVKADMLHLDLCIGCGELAISDHRSSQPSFEEVARIAAECHVGGIMTGKAGILHLHLGDGARLLSLVHVVFRASS